MATNLELVRAAVEAFGRGEIPALLEMCSDSVEVVLEGDPTTLPFAGRWTGKSRVGEYFRRIGETLDVLKWEPHHYVGSGDRVVAVGWMSTRAKTTGKTVRDSGWALDFTVANDKVTGWQVYLDTAAAEKALRP